MSKHITYCINSKSELLYRKLPNPAPLRIIQHSPKLAIGKILWHQPLFLPYKLAHIIQKPAIGPCVLLLFPSVCVSFHCAHSKVIIFNIFDCPLSGPGRQHLSFACISINHTIMQSLFECMQHTSRCRTPNNSYVALITKHNITQRSTQTLYKV